MKRSAIAVTMFAASALALTACDSGGGASAPGAVSEGEAAALDEAAEMLEERNLPDGALPPIDGPVVQDEAPIQEPQSDDPAS